MDVFTKRVHFKTMNRPFEPFIGNFLNKCRLLGIYLTIATLSLISCGQPVEYIIDEAAIDSLETKIDSLENVIFALEIRTAETVFPDYSVSPRAGAIRLDPDWSRWSGIITGLLINTGEDTLKGVAMRFTLKTPNGDMLTSVIGHFTLDQVQFKLFSIDGFPYTEVFNLAPDVKYFFYAATEVMTYNVNGVGWWFTPLVRYDGE